MLKNPAAAVLPLNPAVVPLVRSVFALPHLGGTGDGTGSGTCWYRSSASDADSGGSGYGSGGGSSRAVVPLNPAVLPPPGSFLLFQFLNFIRAPKHFIKICKNLGSLPITYRGTTKIGIVK